MMRSLVLSLLLLALATPALAVDTYTVPITAVSGLPFSEFIMSDDLDCALGQGTFSAEIVNGGLEVEFDGSAVAASSSRCLVLGTKIVTVPLQTPELGGTVTMVRIAAEPLVEDFVSLSEATARFDAENGTTSLIPGLYNTTLIS